MAPNRMSSSASEGGLSGANSKLSDKRREKLINLKKREDLKDALTEKFKGRFGHGARERDSDEMSVASSCIRKEVDRFAKSADVTEANLSRLERRIQGRAKQGPRGSDDASSVAGVSAYSGQSRRSQSVASLAGMSVLKGSNNAPPESFDWSKLDEYASYLHEQDALRQKLGVQALQKKLRMDLDAQVADKQKKRENAQEEDRRYHQNSLVELERWKEMEQIREEDRHKKIMKEKTDRDAQLEFERNIKANEEQQKKDEESNLVEKIITEMETEQRKFEKKKEQTKQAMRKVFEENQLDQQKRTLAAKDQKEKEAAAMKEYNRVMDEQEEQRQEELNARLEKQAQLMKKLQDNVAAVQKGAGDNDAQRALAQQEEMDRHFFEAEAMKQQRLKELRIENQSYLLKQMEEKDLRKEDDRQLTNIQAQILHRDTEEYNSIERQKVIDRKARNIEHRREIEKQMEYKHSVSNPQMSDIEMKLNKPLLTLVNRTLQNRDQCSEEYAAEEDA